MQFSGQAARRARGERSQKEVAAKAGLSMFTINRLENGHHKPELATIATLAKALDVDFEDLLEPNGDTKETP